MLAGGFTSHRKQDHGSDHVRNGPMDRHGPLVTYPSKTLGAPPGHGSPELELSNRIEMNHHIDTGLSPPRNLLVTGIPRSGTTLTCWLVNQLPNSVALAEPMNVTKLTEAPDTEARLLEIGEFIDKVRGLALNGRPLPGLVIKDGGSNLFSSVPGGRRRSMVVASGGFEVNKTLRPDFLLAIKHPNAFAALLPSLVGRFECCAMVRNPLSVLASWETIEAPVHNGHAPYAEATDHNLRRTLDGIPDVIDRQLALLDWYFQTFTSTLPVERVIRYEDVINSNGRTLSGLIPAATHLPELLERPLTSRNRNPIYDNGSHISRCADSLLDSTDHACWKLYERSEVIEVYEATRDRRR